MNATISDIAVMLRNGKSVKQLSEAGGLPITRIETIADWTIDQRRCGYAGLSADDSADWMLNHGDILISHINSSKHLGKCALYDGQPKQLIHGMNLLCLRTDQNVADPRYVWRMIASPSFRRQIPRITKNSVNQSSFNISNFLKLKLRLPSLPEQKRIAAILDKADELRAKRREAIAEMDKLVRATFLDMFGDPVTNPRKLSQSSLKDVFQFTTGKLDSNAAVEGGKYPFFTCAKENFAIDEYAFDCEALLLAGNNANADYSVKHFKGKFNAYQRTYVISVDKAKLTYEYARTALEFMLADLKRYSKGSNTKYLTLSILNRMPILLPSLDEQHRFSQRKNAIYRQVSVCRNHENSLNSLFQSLQSRAFNGEL